MTNSDTKKPVSRNRAALCVAFCAGVPDQFLKALNKLGLPFGKSGLETLGQEMSELLTEDLGQEWHERHWRN